MLQNEAAEEDSLESSRVGLQLHSLRARSSFIVTIFKTYFKHINLVKIHPGLKVGPLDTVHALTTEVHLILTVLF